MTHNELRQKYLEFFKSKGHAIVPSTSIVPENDPTTLFTGSGMQPMIVYLLGEIHPLGTRIVDSQRCFRTQDIEEVGDNRHTTAFEMLGNWSFGDYFKQEQLSWIFEFLTKELAIDKDHLYVTVFAGDGELSADTESIAIWQQLFNTSNPAKSGKEGFDPQTKIYSNDVTHNWWSRNGTPDQMPAGEPGGPDSEVFYDFDPSGALQIHQKSTFAALPCHLNCDCGRFLEIGNSVFMQYQKMSDGSFQPLPKRNVDFGGGLERILAAVGDDPDIFKTDLFLPIIKKIETISSQNYDKDDKTNTSFRVIADHIRAAVMLAYDGVEPSNKQQGYFARRLIRRAMRYGKMIGINSLFLADLVPLVTDIYSQAYPEIKSKETEIREIILLEETKFEKALDRGLKEFEKSDSGELNALFAFNLYQTYGFPFEITQELFSQRGVKLANSDFESINQKHKQLSQTASKGMFAGGLADHSEAITKLHTATHLLNQALRIVLKRDDIMQVGSNITAERLRFDFTYPDKITDEQMKQVEDLVNVQIAKDLTVNFELMDKEEALKVAVGAFSERYGDKVKVYSIKEFSKEICGGPHVEHTGVLGKFEIGKQEAVGSGKRRIYGYLK